MAKKKKLPKESPQARAERIALSGAATTRVVQSKKKYSLKVLKKLMLIQQIQRMAMGGKSFSVKECVGILQKILV